MDLLDLAVDLDRRGDYAAGVYRSLRAAIADGRLEPGDRLPPTRVLAAALAVSRNTVAAAYDRLTAEGFVAGRAGAGTFVTPAARAHDDGSGSGRPPGALRPRRSWTSQPAPTPRAMS